MMIYPVTLHCVARSHSHGEAVAVQGSCIRMLLLVFQARQHT